MRSKAQSSGFPGTSGKSGKWALRISFALMPPAILPVIPHFLFSLQVRETRIPDRPVVNSKIKALTSPGAAASLPSYWSPCIIGRRGADQTLPSRFLGFSKRAYANTDAISTCSIPPPRGADTG